jgi:hypothetical protein
MHGAPSGTGSAGVGSAEEDLNNVLTRFQEWSRKGPSASKSGLPSNIGRVTPSKKVSLAAGARELSYEQALRATSYRRQSYQTPAQAAPPQPLATTAAELPELDSLTTATKKTSTAPAAKASSTDPPRAPKNAKSRADRRARISASASVETAAAVIGATTAPQSATLPGVPPRPSANRRKRASGVEPKSPILSHGRNRAPQSSLPAAVQIDPALPELTQLRNPSPTRSPSIQPAVAQPAFREVIQQSAGLAATAKESATPENKTIALSLRVSDAEQARIQACAARANVSVSAYLRQCALGVEELRDQVELALGELRKQDTQKATPPGLSAIPRILRDAATGWLRRVRGNRDYTGISLR